MLVARAPVVAGGCVVAVGLFVEGVVVFGGAAGGSYIASSHVPLGLLFHQALS